MKGALYQEVPQEESRTTKPFSQRWFGPMQPGGFRGSLLTLCSSMIGVGFLTLPEIGKKNGLVPMVGFILVSAFISVFANWQIGRGFRHTQGKTYSKIVARIDSRTSSLVNMVFLFLYVYVSAGAYYIFGSLS
jgi:amino acid permease